jgi:hypothetical protein
MGRHSAPDDDLGAELGPAGVPVPYAGAGVATAAPPRHARPEPDAAAEADGTAAAEASAGPAVGVEPAVGIEPAVGTEPGGARPGGAPVAAGTRGDWQLLRSDRRLALGCLAVLVLAFAVYSGVLYGLTRLDVYAIWVWMPIVVSGVAVGALLDVAHRRRNNASAAETSADDASTNGTSTDDDGPQDQQENTLPS